MLGYETLSDPRYRVIRAGGSPTTANGRRGKREPGASPGLPRSGERERPPSPSRYPRDGQSTGRPRVREATASRPAAGRPHGPAGGDARESEDLPPASMPEPGYAIHEPTWLTRLARESSYDTHQRPTHRGHRSGLSAHRAAARAQARARGVVVWRRVDRRGRAHR